MADVVRSTKSYPGVKKGQSIQRLGWWLLFGICILYSLYALYMGIVEIAFQLGLVSDVSERSVPTVFVVHALSGSVVLVTGILQFNWSLLVNHRALHHRIGRVYLVMVWLASLGGLWLALFFDVSLIARIIFIILALLWFGITTTAFQLARKRKFKLHRVWMYRSFALSFFFVTFSFWVDGLASLLPEEIAYPLAVFVSWSLNLLVAEIWIRRSSPTFPVRQPQDE